MNTSIPPQAPQPPHSAFPPPQGPPTGPVPPAAGFFDSIRRIGIVRTEQRWIGGVAGGVARRFGIDPAIVRGIFAVSVLLGGLGVWVYGLAWALLPEERDGRIHLQEAFAGRFNAALIGAAAMFVIGLSGPLSWRGGDGFFFNGFFAFQGVMVTIALVVLVVVGLSRRSKGERATPPPTGATGWGSGPELWAEAPADTSERTTTMPDDGATTPVPDTSGYPSGGNPTGPNAESTSAAQASAAAAAAATGYGYAPTGHGPVGQAPGASSWSSQKPAARYDYGYVPPVPPVPPVGRQPYAHYYAPQPAVVPVVVPPKPRVLGPGSVVVSIVFALGLFAAAGIILAERADRFTGHDIFPFTAAVGIFIVLAGLGIIVSGARGRRSGVLGFVAVMALIVGVAAGGASDQRWHQSSFSTVWAPTSTSTAGQGYDLGIGDLTLNLQGLSTTGATASNPVTIPVHLGAGDLTITMPEGIPARVEAHVGLGQLTISGNPGLGSIASNSYDQSWSGANINHTYTTGGDGDPVIILQVDLGVGDADIHEPLGH